MYYALVFLPLLGALIVGLLGRYLDERWSQAIPSGAVVIAAALSWLSFADIAIAGHTRIVPILHWLQSGGLDLSWSLRIDTLTAVMLVVVTNVSALVHIYSIGYMSHDPARPRFFAYLSLFTFMMLMLVTADNFMQLFFGWEGVGLASYLLIGFWYKKPSANAAALKAFIVNRVGDLGLLLGIAAIFFTVGSLDFTTVFEAALPLAKSNIAFLGLSVPTLTMICLLLFMGAMGKSAQFFLHTWLPDAMEGPTPVSALIHAATMVTAGVFLLARASPLFEYAPLAQSLVIIIGAVTAFFAASVAMVQNDIKRVIAYSTCSQLGYMFVAMGVGAYQVGIFHLFTHAFFKALLFLGAGSVIHAMGDQQDMRKMGGLRQLVPITWVLMLIGTLALTGFPLTAGFFSKDAVIEAAYASTRAPHMLAFGFLLVAAFLTSFYAWRLMFMTFHGPSRASKEVTARAHESPPIMLVPLIILAIGALSVGYGFKELFIGKNEIGFWGVSLYNDSDNHILHTLHLVPLWVKLSPLVAMLLGFCGAWYCYIFRPALPARIAAMHDLIYTFLHNKWYFDELYRFLFVRPAYFLARLFWRGGDMRLIDGFGPNGMARSVLQLSARFVRVQTGYVYHYAFIMLLGICAMVTWLLLGQGVS